MHDDDGPAFERFEVLRVDLVLERERFRIESRDLFSCLLELPRKAMEDDSAAGMALTDDEEGMLLMEKIAASIERLTEQRIDREPAGLFVHLDGFRDRERSSAFEGFDERGACGKEE